MILNQEPSLNKISPMVPRAIAAACSGALWEKFTFFSAVELLMKKRCFEREQENSASSTTPLPPLLLKRNKSLRLGLIHHPGRSPHSGAFALSRARRVVKLSSMLPKWVNVYLQLTGAGSGPKCAEDSPISQTAFRAPFPGETMLSSGG